VTGRPRVAPISGVNGDHGRLAAPRAAGYRDRCLSGQRDASGAGVYLAESIHRGSRQAGLVISALRVDWLDAACINDFAFVEVSMSHLAQLAVYAVCFRA